MNFIPPQDETRLQAAASGVLPNGKPVVVNADGTVSVVDATSGGPSANTPAVFEAAATDEPVITFDSSSNKIVIAYGDGGNNYYGTAIVGTVSGTSISFGTPVVYNSAYGQYNAITFDSNGNKVVVAYRDTGNSNRGKAIVGTVSGTNISFGSEAQFESGATAWISATFDSNSNKVVIAYRDDDNSSQGTAIVGTVSGTSISFGSSVVFATGTTNYTSTTFDSNSNKIVIAYQYGSPGLAIVGTVSGTSISFGTAATFDSSASTNMKATFDSNSNKVVIAYTDGGSSSYGTAIVGTVSGTDISYGTGVVFENGGQVTVINASFDSTSNKVIIAYADPSDSGYFGTVRYGTVSGTSISFGSELVFESANSNQISVTFDSNSNQAVVAYRDDGNSQHGTAVTILSQGTNLTSENYIGMSGGDVFFNPTFGTASVFEAAATKFTSIAFDSNSNKVVIAYQDDANSDYGTAIVGTVDASNNSITYGSPTVFESARCDFVRATFDNNSNKVVIVYQDFGNDLSGTAIVGTVSGTSISFGSAAVFEAGNTKDISTCFDSNSNKVVIAYSDGNASSSGKSVVATVSGTSISFGTVVTFNSGETSDTSLAFDSNSNKVVVSYAIEFGTGTSAYGTAKVGTVSGTDISFGSAVTFNSSVSFNFASTFDSNSNKIIIFFMDKSNSERGGGIVGTVSGTSISFGSASFFAGDAPMGSSTEATFDSDLNKAVIPYAEGALPLTGFVRTATVSGTSLTFSDAITISTAGQKNNFGIAYDTNANRAVISYRDDGNSSNGTALVYNVGGGDIRGQVASGSSASVDIIGTVNEQQTGLTAGQQYFVQTDGTIGLTADDPSVFAGTAISATELLVKA